MDQRASQLIRLFDEKGIGKLRLEFIRAMAGGPELDPWQTLCAGSSQMIDMILKHEFPFEKPAA